MVLKILIKNHVKSLFFHNFFSLFTTTQPNGPRNEHFPCSPFVLPNAMTYIQTCEKHSRCIFQQQKNLLVVSALAFLPIYVQEKDEIFEILFNKFRCDTSAMKKAWKKDMEPCMEHLFMHLLVLCLYVRFSFTLTQYASYLNHIHNKSERE